MRTKVIESILKKRWNLTVRSACLLAGLLSGAPLFATGVETAPNPMNAEQVRLNVKGVVVDADGNPLIGATVREKGTTSGTITDVDGKFALSVTQGSVLQISYVGMETTEVTVSKGTYE